MPWAHFLFLLPSRLGQTLSVRGEVTDETVFSVALAQAVGQWPGAKLLDHVSVESSILGKQLYHLLSPFLGSGYPLTYVCPDQRRLGRR